MNPLERSVRAAAADAEAAGELSEASLRGMLEALAGAGAEALPSVCLRTAALACVEPELQISVRSNFREYLAQLDEPGASSTDGVSERESGLAQRQAAALRSVRAGYRCSRFPSPALFSQAVRNFRASHYHGRPTAASSAEFWYAWLEDVVSSAASFVAADELTSLLEVVETSRKERTSDWRWEASVDDHGNYSITQTDRASSRMGPVVATAALRREGRAMFVRFEARDGIPLGRIRALHFAQGAILRELTNDAYRGRYDRLEVTEGARVWSVFA